MEDGWIKLHRKMREWQHYQCPSVRLVFEELLFCANTRPKWYHGKKVGRGETMVSITSLQEYTGYDRKTVIKALKILVESGEIKREKFLDGMKTTIRQFGKYQDDEREVDGGIIPPSTPPRTPPQSPPRTPPPTPPRTPPKQEYKEYKELKKERNIYIDVSDDTSSSDDYSSDAAKGRTDYKKLISFFNRTMDEAKAVIPRCKSCDGKRKEYVNGRIREHGLDAVYEMITKAAASDFLNGGGSRGFVADFTWLFRPSNFQKVLEGNYDNRQNHGTRDYERQRRADDAADLVNKLLAEDGQP